MSTQSIRKFFIPALCVLMFTPLLGPISQWAWADQRDGVLTLKPPPFVSVASAQGGSSFIDQEAGIAAYIDSGQTINLAEIESIYDSKIDIKTDTYIIGSVTVPVAAVDELYNDNHNVKLYMHVDGWIMAYYHKSEPTSKIIDWRNWGGTGNLPTVLETVLDIAATKVAQITFNPTYYHFGYPNANSMSLIADEAYGSTSTESFEITLPEDFFYWERSWAVGGANLATSNDDFTVNLLIDDIDVGSASVLRKNYGYAYDTLTQLQLQIGEHTIRTTHNIYYSADRQFFGLAIVYQVP